MKKLLVFLFLASVSSVGLADDLKAGQSGLMCASVPSTANSPAFSIASALAKLTSKLVIPGPKVVIVQSGSSEPVEATVNPPFKTSNVHLTYYTDEKGITYFQYCATLTKE